MKIEATSKKIKDRRTKKLSPKKWTTARTRNGDNTYSARGVCAHRVEITQKTNAPFFPIHRWSGYQTEIQWHTFIASGGFGSVGSLLCYAITVTQSEQMTKWPTHIAQDGFNHQFSLSIRIEGTCHTNDDKAHARASVIRVIIHVYKWWTLAQRETGKTAPRTTMPAQFRKVHLFRSTSSSTCLPLILSLFCICLSGALVSLYCTPVSGCICLLWYAVVSLAFVS